MEQYKIINNFDDYEISNLRNVRNVKTGRILKQSTDKRGYNKIGLWKNTKQTTLYLHRLLADAFILNPNNKPLIDHINGNKTDNSIENLRWCTVSENMHNRTINGNNTSGCKGVCFSKRTKKWLAQIKLNNKTISIGYYDKLEDAVLARKTKASQIFGVFTHHIEKIKTELELLEDELNAL